MSTHPRELLSAFLDDELPPHEKADVEQHLSDCTECSRELAIMRHLGGAMRSIQTERSRSVWDGVHRRITRPIGWILLVAGFVVWAALGLIAWSREELTLEWAATSAIGVGLVFLLIGVGYEQYREWKETRYKDIQK